MVLKALHKYIRIYLYAFWHHPTLPPRSATFNLSVFILSLTEWIPPSLPQFSEYRIAEKEQKSRLKIARWNENPKN